MQMNPNVRRVLSFVILISAVIATGCDAIVPDGCQLTSADAERFLGGDVTYLSRDDSLLDLTEDERGDERVSACGYKTKDGSWMMLQENRYASEAEAVATYDLWREKIASTQKKGGPGDYWEVDRFAVYGDATMVHAYHSDGEHVDVAGRVGTTAFLIRSLGAPSNKAFSYVELRSYAVATGQRLAGKK